MTRRASPSLWLFALAAMPYGSFNGIVAVGLPYVLRRHGFTVERIASIGALVQAPAIWYVLWAPIVDLKFRRRTWILVLSLTSALCTAAGFAVVGPAAIRLAIPLLIIASAIAQPISSAIGGLVATVVPSEGHARAAGWSQGGILIAGVIAGGLTVLLSDHASAPVVALAIGIVMALPALAATAIAEPRSARGATRDLLRRMLAELSQLVRRREAWIGLVFFMSPVGAGALMNLFSAAAPEFHASSTIVVTVVALAGAVTAVGALIGGPLLERVDGWHSYPIAGLLTAVVVGAMLLAPLNPATYVIGASFYALITGFAYTAYMAIALELVGSDTTASGTVFTLFTAAVNVPVVYMLRLDGLGHARFGVRGMLGADGAANVIFALVLFLLLRMRAPSATKHL